jgi:hypothetical protein
VPHCVWQRRAIKVGMTDAAPFTQRLEVFAVGEALLVALDEVELMFRIGD